MREVLKKRSAPLFEPPKRLASVVRDVELLWRSGSSPAVLKCLDRLVLGPPGTIPEDGAVLKAAEALLGGTALVAFRVGSFEDEPVED